MPCNYPYTLEATNILLLCESKVPFELKVPSCVTCNIASRVRTWNCAGPGTPSNLIPGAPE
eukprot:5566653-Alexandrium_andersonii.AAC.1